MSRIIFAIIFISIATLNPARTSHKPNAEEDALHRLVALSQKTEDENYEELKDEFNSIPYETISDDVAGIMGREGYIFVFKGTNDWEQQALNPNHFQESHYQQWVSLIRQRQKKAKQLGTRLYQMVVPEKQAVIPHLRWEQVPTAFEQRFLKQLQIRLNQGELLYPLETLTEHAKEYVLYPREDSHWNALGCWLYFKPILESIWPKHKFNLESLEVTALARPSGDLLVKYIPSLLKTTHIPRFVDKSYKVYENAPLAPRTYMGHCEVLYNPDAVIKERLVIFGNSFTYFTALAIFTAFVEHVTFFWHTHIAWDVMKELKPDVILWQTTERFLSIVPNDTWTPVREHLAAHKQAVKFIQDIKQVPGFSAFEYISCYQDLMDATRGMYTGQAQAFAEQHYLSHGVQERRTYRVTLPTDFSALEYISCHKDLMDATRGMSIGQAEAWAENHYRVSGIRERRAHKVTLPVDFSPLNYVVANADLSRGVSNLSESEAKAWAEKHYREHGIREGRSYTFKN